MLQVKVIELDKHVIYFGRPVTHYGKPHDVKIAALILKTFGEGSRLVDPSLPEHQVGYQAQGMAYFLETVVPSCTTGVFTPFKDGRWGAGVWAELCRARALGMPTYTVDWKLDLRPKFFSERIDIAPFPSTAGVVPLTVEETRARVRAGGL